MKQLVCELCGSVELIKQDGVFVCQACGSRYSVEEARKMMVEGSVDVSGSTVRVDNTEQIEKLYQVARRARDNENSEDAAKYYEKILLEEPDSWEAQFYTVYFKAMSCKIAEIRSAANSVENCVASVLKLIQDYVPAEEHPAAVHEVVSRCISLASMLAGAAKSHYDGISSSIRKDYSQEYTNNVCAARDILYTCGDSVDSTFKEDTDISKLAADAWKKGIEIHKWILPMLSNLSSNAKTIDTYAEKIGQYDPVYHQKHLLMNRKKAVSLEISSHKRTIQNTKTKFDWAAEAGPLVGGVLWCSIGVILGLFLLGFPPIMIISEFIDHGKYAFYRFSTGEYIAFFFTFLFGLLMAVLCYSGFRSAIDSVKEERRQVPVRQAKVARLKEELSKLEAELAQLEAELKELQSQQ